VGDSKTGQTNAEGDKYFTEGNCGGGRLQAQLSTKAEMAWHRGKGNRSGKNNREIRQQGGSTRFGKVKEKT